jgi:hypothetical protein
MYRGGPGPFLRVEVRVGGQVNFIIRIGGNPTPGPIFFFTNEACVRMLYTYWRACNPCNVPLFLTHHVISGTATDGMSMGTRTRTLTL